MSYLSLSFVAFTAISVLAYYLLPRKARPGVLLVASVAFYAVFDPRCVAFLFFTAASTYVCARMLPRLRRKWVAVGVCAAAVCGVWFAIKELPWLLTTAERVLSRLGVSGRVPTLSLLMPVGISYYSLQALGYLLDVARGKYPPERRFWRYLLFLSWFPAVVQGPISRYDRLMPELLHRRPFSYDGMRSGLLLILFGLVKKMVVADRLGLFVDYCFTHYADLGGAVLYVAAVGYAFQLYTDFAGCVDICRGVSRLFGVELAENFARPYLARSVKEFWGRWHMTFSGWLKDYVYIPLGGNRKGTARKYGNVLAVFLVSGLWHGAGFHYLAWGLLHAVYQIVGDATLPWRRRFKARIGPAADSAAERVYQRFITFHLVLVAWIFFRAGGLATAWEYVCAMVSSVDVGALLDGTVFTFGVSRNAFIWVGMHLLLRWVLEHRYPRQQDAVDAVIRLHLPLRWAVYLLLLFDVLLFGVYGSGYDTAGFMYGGF